MPGHDIIAAGTSAGGLKALRSVAEGESEPPQARVNRDGPCR